MGRWSLIGECNRFRKGDDVCLWRVIGGLEKFGSFYLDVYRYA